jgi:hypothetical protein
MSQDTLSTHQKALAVNLDDKVYGTLAEIGAAQEVARWFFRVGAAAGSIAKTISAYDKQISDDIYGEAGRYVSRERLESMLTREYDLLLRRLSASRGHDTRFFAFCNTVSARNFAGTNECQGWVGLRYQSAVGGKPNTIVLHINMLDDSSVAQQEVVGILGVNLIYGAFFQADGSGETLSKLVENTGSGRLEADLIDATGPAFSHLDSVATGMAIVQSGLAKAVLLDRTGRQHPPTEILHKKPTVLKRTSLRYLSPINSASLEQGAARLLSEDHKQQKSPLLVTEFSINNVHAGENTGPEQVLAHLRQLLTTSDWVMLTDLAQNFMLTSYIRRYSRQPVRYVVGISTLVMLFSDQFYENSVSSMLEATGKLYSEDARVYVLPMSRADFQAHIDSADVAPGWFTVSPDQDPVTLERLSFSGPLQKLFEYLLESGWIQELQEEQADSVSSPIF